MNPPLPIQMNKPNLNPDDARLAELLRASRAAPPLPPCFHENVWRRIENTQANDIPAAANWLDTLASLILRPRLAFAIAAVLLLAGVGLGWNKGETMARHEAQSRYLASVAPNALR